MNVKFVAMLKESKHKGGLEDRLLEMCKPPCEGKEVIDSSEHLKSCPCRKYLKNLGF